MGYMIGHVMGSKPRQLAVDQLVVLSHSHLNSSLKFTHYLTTDFQGGLGSLMFQYASLYGIAKANGMVPVISEFSHLTSIFPSLYSDKSTESRNGARYWPAFHEHAQAQFDKRSFSLNFMRNLQLQGMFQSWKYFDHVREEILSQFDFADEVKEEADAVLFHAWRSSMYSGMPMSNVTFVGVHVRRGDFLDAYNADKGYRAADAAYIKRAMQYFISKYHNIIFVVCSDDQRWSKVNVRSKTGSVYLSTRGSASLDLCILSRCNHTIMTVGSFGWWAGYLTAGDTVYYKDNPIPGSSLAHSFNHKDFYYPKWIPL